MDKGFKDRGEYIMKDYTRDYATEAFRFYAKIGRPRFDDLKEKIYSSALELGKREGIKTNNICSPTELAVMKAEKAVLDKKAELEDVLAVEKTLETMERLRGKAAREAIELIYFTDAQQDLKKGDIERRVAEAGMKINADRATIYRWLGQARKEFCRERGLRLSNKQINKIIQDATTRGREGDTIIV